ncbi:hypothetical protein [Mycobacterium uberis]|uniref:hypothetical protein n=1 Tax=Mycobacterium uberis TaxID=2162698 RepID=UPI001FB25C25|nr:hypothetical protein [Mycobacterium uberis]
MHGLVVKAHNQVSLLPADLVADHVVALMAFPGTADTVFNITTDYYCNLMGYHPTVIGTARLP